MATWAEFVAGPAEVSGWAGAEGGVAGWEPFDGGGAAMAVAGERVLSAAPAGIALLGTVAASGRPRIHPFMPRVIDGRLWAFVMAGSPKARDLLHRPCTIHARPAEEDEEFWVSGRARRDADHATVERLAADLPWAKPDAEWLFEFDLELAGWTRWLDFGTARHRPLHHRWRA